MTTEEPLFPRAAAAATAGPAKKKKRSLLEKSLGFLMEDSGSSTATPRNRPIDYEALKRLIRKRIKDSLFEYLEAQHKLTDEKRREVELIIKFPEENSLAAEAETRYIGLKTLFDIRLRVPADVSCEPHPSWLGTSVPYGVPSWMVRLSVIEPLLDSLPPADRQKLLGYLEKGIEKGEEPTQETSPFSPEHPCSAVFLISGKFTQPENISIVTRARQIPDKAPLMGPQLRYLNGADQVAFVNDTTRDALAAMIQVVRSAQALAEEYSEKNPKESLPKDAISNGDAFDDMCSCNVLLMKLLSKDADDVKARERWVTFLSDMLNAKGLNTWPALNTHSRHLDIMRDHADALRVIMDNLEHFSEKKIKMFLESFQSIEQMERFYNKLKEDFPDSLKVILPLPNFDAILQKAAEAFKQNRRADYDTVVQTMRSRLEKLLSAEQKHEASATGNVRGTQF